MSNARRRAIAAVAYEAYRLRAASSRMRALPASCASRGPDASKGLRLQQRVVNAAMEHVRDSLQLLLWPYGASYASPLLHLVIS